MFTRQTTDDGFTLATERLTLRWPRRSDAAAIETLAGRKSVADMTALIPHPYPEGAADQFIFASRLANASGEGLTLAITLSRKPRELIGVIALQRGFPGKEDSGEPSLGYWLGVEHWGQGFATEAGGAMVDLAFQETGISVVGAGALTRNAASLRVLNKLGFRETGAGLAPFPARGGMMPVVYLELGRSAREAATSAVLPFSPVAAE